ncbi:hypothetical protein QT381_07660 [Galbitalea sp. SE-J8]|uniref:hypothetical protein n=1 Tax=Galbitalea sp. SE-J8 TaxID=3054952 RepID=UPI00259D14D8|nr:hypothetical protein [Galbitalea sp. SE-J8]MDM4762880.1 hypothetical protein [Galbitalea sp. SE-J8]
MPRSNRPRGRRREEPEALDLARATAGFKRTEVKRDGDWYVQPQRADSAVKAYTCPACGLEIGAGVAHVVAWRADGILGDADALAARRHWHTHCWRIRP